MEGNVVIHMPSPCQTKIIVNYIKLYSVFKNYSMQSDHYSELFPHVHKLEK